MRLRVVIACAVVATCAVVAFFVPAALAVSNAEREAQVVELQQEAIDAAAASADGLEVPAHDEGVHDPRGAAKERGEDEHVYAIYDADAALVEGDGPPRLERPLRPALLGRARSTGGEGLRVVAVPLAGGRALRAAEPADEADERVREAVTRLAAVGLLLVLAAAALAWVVAGRLIRPVRRLADAARQLGGGDLTASAPATGVREIDEVATALNVSAGRIGQLIERERRLTADTSHQLRTPLAGLRISLEGELADPTDGRLVLEEALDAVLRMERTVADLTDLARDELPTAPFAVWDAVEAARGRWNPSYSRAGRRIDVAAASALVTRARRPAVDAILDVLLENALEHGAGSVVVELSGGAGGVQVTVQDDGRCAASDDELFGRRSSLVGSSGIGLHLARTLAEEEGGRLRLTGASPTTFTLQLPG